MPPLGALAAVPAILGATGVALPAGLGTALTVIPAALSVAKGVINKDPFAIGTGLLSGATAGLGSLAGAAGSAASAGANAGASIGSAAPSLMASAPQVANSSRQALSDTNGTNGSIFGSNSGAAAGTLQNNSMSPLQIGSSVLGGLATGAQGVTSLVDALRRTGQHENILGGPLQAGLSPAYGTNSRNLPGVPNYSQSSAPNNPESKFHGIADDSTLLQLLGAYRG